MNERIPLGMQRTQSGFSELAYDPGLGRIERQSIAVIPTIVINLPFPPRSHSHDSGHRDKKTSSLLKNGDVVT